MIEITPQIKDATEAIQSLPSLINAIGSLFSTPWGGGLLLAIFLWIILNQNSSRVFAWVAGKKQKRLEALNSYLADSGSADLDALQAVKDQRDSYYFKVATGIYAEGTYRTALIKLHHASSHTLTWTHIRRAQEYLRVSSAGEVSVHPLSKFDWFAYWYNQLVAYSCLFVSVGLLTLVFTSSERSSWLFFLGFGGAFGIALFAMFVLSLNWPVASRKRVENELIRLHKK